MNNIDLAKIIKGYAEEAERNGFKVLTVPLRDLHLLIDQLETTQRERDGNRQMITNTEHQLAETKLLLAGTQEKLGKALKRNSEYAGELSRRDAAAGEHVAWQFFDNGQWYTGSDRNNHRKSTESAGYRVRNLYTASQPAAQDIPCKVYQICKLDGSEERQQWCDVSITEYYGGGGDEDWGRRILYTAPGAADA